MKKYLFGCLLVICITASHSIDVFAIVDVEKSLPNVTEFPSEYFPSYMDKAVDLFRDGKFRKARSELRELRSKKSQFLADEKIYLLEGLCLRWLEKNDSAIEAFKYSLKLRGSNSDALYFLSVTLLEKGMTEESLRGFQEALWFSRMQIVGKDMILKQIADVYSKEDDRLKATEYYRRAINQNPDSIEARVGLSEIHLREGQKAEAVSLLKDGMKRVPEDDNVKLALVRATLHGASRMLDQKSLKEASELCSNLLKEKVDKERTGDPVFPLYVRTLIETGELEKAEEELSAAVENAPENTEFQRLVKQLSIEKEIISNRKDLKVGKEDKKEA